jgi:hypothetical protein
LDTSGKLNVNVIPSVALMDVETVATQAEMLALTTVQKGDICIITSENKTYILAATPASTLANWKQILTPLAEVTKTYVDSQDAATISTIKGTGLTSAYDTLAKIEAIIKSNKTAADSTQTSLTNVESRVSTAESDISSLKSGKSNIYKTTASSGTSAAITAATHKCGTTPLVSVYMGGKEIIAEISVDASGNVTVSWNGEPASAMTIVIIGI